MDELEERDQRKDWHLTEALHYAHGRGDPFAAAVRATRMPMVITNPRLPDNPIVFCNEAFQGLTGYDRDEIVGRNCRFLQGPKTDPAAVAGIAANIKAGQDVGIDLLNYRKDGTTFWNALYISPVRDEAGAISFYFASQLDVTERVMAEQRAIARREEVEREVATRTADLERALEAKTLLLHELDHRVKNNLMMVGSLLRLESRSSADPAVTATLQAMLQRVDALGAVHRRLFQTRDVTRFDVGKLLHELAAELVAVAGPGRIALAAEIEPIEIASGNASVLGLILNEILSSAIQRGFPGERSGTLHLRTQIAGSTAGIEIAANGPGLVASVTSEFGQRLIERLAHQIGISISWSELSPGTGVSLTIPLE